MTYVKGLDVSYYEPKVNWNSVRAQGYYFAFVKATQGIGVVDPRFANHWAGAKQAGLLRGAYHYLVVAQDPIKQANLFLSTLAGDLGEFSPVLDLEGKYNETATNRQILAVAKAWLDYVGQVTGRKPMIYSAYFFLRDKVSVPFLGIAPGWAKDYPLWIAQYLNRPATENDAPLQPKGWQDWKFWQHSEKGMLGGITNDDGIPTAVDLNYFRGNLDDLYAFAGLPNPTPIDVPAPTPTPPPTPVPVPTPPMPSGPITYTVAPGDNLYSIANRFHTTVDAIIHLNNITNPDLIYPGQVLVIPQ